MRMPMLESPSPVGSGTLLALAEVTLNSCTSVGWLIAFAMMPTVVVPAMVVVFVLARDHMFDAS